jgi:HK97 family phage portal protein
MTSTEAVQKSVTGGLYNGFTIDNGYVTNPIGYSSNFSNYKLGDEIAKGYDINDDVYSIVSKIARTISNQIVWKIREVNTVNGESENIENSELEKLLHTPNSYETLGELREKCITYLLLSGNNFVGGIKGIGAKSYESIHVLPSQCVNIEQGTLSDPVKSITVQWDLQEDWDVKDVGITKYPSVNIDTYFLGHSPLRSGQRLLESSNDLITADSYYLKNRGANGMLTNDGEDDIIAPKSMEEVQKNLTKQLGGAEKFNMIWATNAKLKYTRFGLDPSDLKILESDIQKRRRLNNLFGLDSSLFNDPENKTYNNQKEANKAAFENVYIPNDKKVLRTFNKWLSPKYPTGKVNTKLEIYQDLSDIDTLQQDRGEKVKIQEKQSKEVRLILTDVANGNISKEAALVLLVDVHEFNEDKAELLTTEVIRNEQGNNNNED